MTLLEQLIATDAPVVHDLITAYAAQDVDTVHAEWNNNPTWDNWKKSPAPFDNRPTWDNWKKNG